VVAQDEDQRRARSSEAHTRSETVLILGGCGGMGRWLSSYFDSFGYPVTVFDPRSASDPSPYPAAEDLELAVRSHGIVVLATPIGATAQVLRRVIRTRTEALVFDICSLKSPLQGTIQDGLRKGLRIASIHPMFGPSATVLAGRNIVFCETGKRDHSPAVRRLFEPTTARLISVPLRRHDRVMGYVLGLSHMVSLVFGRALATGGISAAELGSFSSTTFNAQARVSAGVAAENQDLYFDIQAENAATPAVLEGFRAALDEFRKAVSTRDRSRFKTLMESARQFFSEQQAAR
jgi:chorismate mutase/prephenate dehydrogenase